MIKAISVRWWIATAVMLLSVVAAKHHQAPLYNYGLEYRVTDLVNMTLTYGGKSKGNVTIALFGKTVPKAVENFKALCLMSKGFGYKNTSIHRVLKDFILQGGDFELHNGKGGYSIYDDTPGKRFAAENYNIPHQQGSVAMASESRTRLGSQFYFVVGTTSDVQFLNGKHVVFGHVVAGFRTILQQLGRVPTSKNDVPKHHITISECTTVQVPTESVGDAATVKRRHLLDDDDDDTSSIGHLEGPKKVHHATAPPEPKGAKQPPAGKGKQQPQAAVPQQDKHDKKANQDLKLHPAKHAEEKAAHGGGLKIGSDNSDAHKQSARARAHEKRKQLELNIPKP